MTHFTLEPDYLAAAIRSAEDAATLTDVISVSMTCCANNPDALRSVSEALKDLAHDEALGELAVAYRTDVMSAILKVETNAENLHAFVNAVYDSRPEVGIPAIYDDLPELLGNDTWLLYLIAHAVLSDYLSLKYCQWVVDHEPASNPYRSFLVTLLLEQGYSSAAYFACAEGKKLYPDEPRWYLGLAEAYYKTSQFTAAMDEYTQVISLFEGRSDKLTNASLANAFSNMAAIASASDVDLAIEYMTRANEAEPSDDVIKRALNRMKRRRLRARG